MHVISGHMESVMWNLQTKCRLKLDMLFRPQPVNPSTTENSWRLNDIVDAMMVKHQAISFHNADPFSIVPVQYCKI